MNKNTFFNVRNLAIMGMMAALAAVLMFFDFPIPFIALNFYKLDFSEIPILIGAFMLGPVAGIVIELVKNLLNILLSGSSTGAVGEFANFCVGCALVVPASFFYQRHKSRKNALIGLAVGTVVMTIASIVLNALVMLPFYSSMMPLENIIAAGAAINPAVSNVWTFCLLTVAPFNLVKAILVSLITMLIYKKISVLLRGNH